MSSSFKFKKKLLERYSENIKYIKGMFYSNSKKIVSSTIIQIDKEIDVPIDIVDGDYNILSNINNNSDVSILTSNE